MKYSIAPFLAFCTLCWLYSPVTAQDCGPARAQAGLATNNVRARLTTGGDLWWDGTDGRYIVPKTPPGVPEVSTLFAGALWMGGLDAGQNLKLAAQTYGRSSGRVDYWPGPLTPNLGNTTEDICDDWDRFFPIVREDIEVHLRDFEDNGLIDGPIPISLRGWPGRGNPLFSAAHGFELPQTNQPLAPFFDRNGDGIYDPREGDYPLVKGDEAYWWVYNDNGGIHRQSGGGALRMEIQATAFAYTGGAGYLNNSTFYEHRLIYRGTEPLDSFYLSLWVDPDLGCYADDYIGCLPEERLAFAYNGDAFDEDCFGVTGYGDEIPIVGIKVLRPLERPNGQDAAPFSSFMYYLNNDSPGAPSSTRDPANAPEFYRYMTGHWRDGSPLTLGGNGYQSGSTSYPYAFDGSLANGQPWTECNTTNAPADRRFLMNFGPLALQPGEIRELAFAVIWVPNQAYPCPGLTALREEANVVQNLYESLLVSAKEEPVAAYPEVQCSPNPMQDYTQLYAGQPIRAVYLFSPRGKLLRAYTGLHTLEFQLQRQGLSTGLYFYQVVLKNGEAVSGKIVVR